MIVACIVALAQTSTTSLPALFSDHMVLQRGKPIPIWGWDKPDKIVKITLNGKSVYAATDTTGTFRIALPPMKEGGPYSLQVDGSTSKTIDDVYVGEVWICSGQSNMEWTVNNTLDRTKAQQEADPNIRMFTVTKKISNTRMNDVTGGWVQAAPTTVDGFSAVGYAFAKKIYRELKVPVGMIHTSWGGTAAEAWTSINMMAKDPMTSNISDRATLALKSSPAGMQEYQDAVRKWQVKGFPDFFGTHSEEAAKSDFDDSSWESATMPYAFPDQFDGTIWFRKEVTLSAAEASSINSISLGAIDDVDMTYVNGEQVGQTDLTVPGFYSAFRKYSIRNGLLKEGRNVIAVRAYDGQGPGGFSGPANVLKLGDISISDGWKMKVEGPKQPPAADAGPQPQPPMTTNDPNFPETLYNGMLYPLAPYGIRGAIWYQGESNAGRAVQYKSLLSTMIKDWRQIFRQGDFPFYIVQLANFMAPSQTQFDSAWAELRDAQDKVGQEKNNGVATILDIGEANDIHPRNKRDVGERLALIALNKDYKKNVEWQGPRLDKVSFSGATATVSFSHSKGLRTADGLAVRAFAIAGEDMKWRWATATIDGNKVILTNADVPKPVAVRYGWQDNPAVNLINGDGLPAMPFRTDSWPLTTRDNR